MKQIFDCFNIGWEILVQQKQLSEILKKFCHVFSNFKLQNFGYFYNKSNTSVFLLKYFHLKA